ncbi:MAG: hypothetical protein GY926_12650 [bacterium]|nr:hypothetical protein [bacterium]
MTSQVLASEPIDRVEFWVDGEKVGTHGFAEPQMDPEVPWQWAADSVGPHAIEVRAFDVSERYAASSPIWMEVVAGWDPQSGEPLTELPMSPLLSSSQGVTVDAARCTATLDIPTAADSVGQAATAATLGVSGTVPVGVVGPDGGTVTVPVTSSPTMVSIVPFDETTSASRPSMLVPGNEDCAVGVWVGDVTFSGTTLDNSAGLDAAYLYVTEGGGIWQRLPATGFATPTAAGFNFTGLPLPAVAGDDVEVEVWGWSDDELINLGRGRYERIAAAESILGPVQPVGPHTLLNVVRAHFDLNTGSNKERLLTSSVLCVDGAFHPDCDPVPQTLRWDTQLLGVEAGLIQVSSTRPPAGPSTDFPGLLWSIMIATDGDRVSDFELALDQIRRGTAPVPEAGSHTSGFRFSDLERMGLELSNGEPAAGGASPRMSQPVAGSWWQGIPPGRLWVRVIPLSNGQPIEGVSNAVLYEVDSERLLIEPPPEQAIDALYDIAVKFNQPLQSNVGFSRCVRVVENPFGSENPAPVPTMQFVYDATRDSARVFTTEETEHRGLVAGATVCAYKPDPPDKDVFDHLGEAVSFIGEAWDTFKDLVDMVKAGIIQGIVDITGCEPEAACKAALNALADAGLAAVGVPPTLPSFSELMESAKGDIAAALTEQLVGQVCDGPCADFAAQFVEDALDDIEDHFSDLATTQAQSGGWVLHLNPEIRVIPEPAGQLFPGSIEVRITRKLDGESIGSAPPETCFVSLRTEGAGPLSWTTKQGVSHVDETVVGPVFASESIAVDLIRLAPGESTTVGVASLDFDRWHYLTGTGPGLTGYSSQERLQSIELWRDPDVDFTMFGDVCGKGFSQPVPKRTAQTPGEIPSQ